MYSRNKGKSGSSKPLEKKKVTWVRYKPSEVESLVLKLAKTGLKPSKIGLILRDSYGIPDVKLITKKSITKILESNKVVYDIPEDLSALIKRQVAVLKHFESNKQDKTAKRGLQLTEAKFIRLIRYYKKAKRLPVNWKYDKTKAKLLVED